MQGELSLGQYALEGKPHAAQMPAGRVQPTPPVKGAAVTL